MVSINKVINVDFNVTAKRPSTGSYKTVVYLISEDITGGSTVKVVGATSSYMYRLCKSYSEVSDALSNNAILCSAANFFNNGGAQLLLVKSTSPSGDTASFKSLFDNLMKALHELRFNDSNFSEDDDFLYVCINTKLESTYGESRMSTVLDAAEASKAPYTYRVILTTDKLPESWPKYLKDAKYSAGLKYCTKKVGSDLIDAALLIGAFYSQVNLNGSETIKDYCYTSEQLTDTVSVSGSTFSEGVEGVSDSDYDDLIQNNANFIDRIGQSVVNFGGNLLNGVSIHTDFGACAAENDVTYAVLNAMMSKQYLTPAGLNKMLSVISASLIRYKSNGYLELGSIYTGDTITRKYNGVQFTIIKKNSSVSQGYLVTAIPIASISEDDRIAKRFTPIYVILQTAAGARVVEITGEVR